MPFALLFNAIHVAILIGFGNGLPVGESMNTTIYREMMDRTVKFPSDNITNRKATESHMFKQSNLSGAVEEPSFVFPDDIPKPLKFIPKISKRSPSCAKGSTFCETIDDYPGDYLHSMLSNKIDEFQSFLGTDIVKEPGIGHRIDAIDENPLCASIEQVVYPKTAKTKEDKWLFVVNQPPYTQGVRIEKCLKSSDSSSQPCAFTEQFPLGYKTSCKQKYIYRKLVALDEDGKTITDNFQLPSCCSCTVKQDSLRSRIGVSRLSTTPVPTSKPKGDE